MCIILKLDLRCCRGCREWMCKHLKRVPGVELVMVGGDEDALVVCGEGFDEAEIVRQVKKRKNTSEVEVVSRISHRANPLPNTDAGIRPSDDVGVKPQAQPKPKIKQKPTVSNGEEEEQQQQSNSTRKVDTLVTERTQEEFEGAKIRTRVTTSQDVCTCIRVEENRFIINKHCLDPHKLNTNSLIKSG